MTRALPLILVLAILPALTVAQQEAPANDLDRVAAEQKLTQRVEHFVEMGMEREMALFMTLMEHSGVEPAEMLTMFMMAEHGEGAGMMMLMDSMKGASTSTQTTLVGDSTLLITEDGVLYKIDLETMQVTGKVAYAAADQAQRDAVWSLIAPLMSAWDGGEIPGGPAATTCASNLRQLGRATGQYVDEHEGTFPGENWVQAVTPYLPNAEILRCPARPDLAVGYAMNDKMLGVAYDRITEPAERILLFDTAVNAESPVGGAELLPDFGAHEDGVMVLFADGRVEWLETPEAREVLGFPVGE
jgi:prepilin-type processing-associated H-X9-DG protein